ncbi:hypothetical protein [Nocardia camponoti]|uniref:hypothetical protein n=1 Tax=Nocardia camponoti TaxID=1616106 RepID=UPI0016648FF8|nr:hypothetical protein [Nocardia camponoti]
MTGPNNQPPDSNAQWWEQPGPGATPNPNQADPTLLRADLGSLGGATPPADPTLLRAPDLGAYQAQPQYGSQPAYQQQQPFAAPQQTGYQPQQTGYQPQYQQAPQPAWGSPPPVQPPRPPSSGGGNKATWWVLGGVFGVVALLVIVLVAVAASSGGDDDKKSPIDPFKPDSSKWAGSYAFKDGKNSCELIDPSVLNQWSSTRETTTHREYKPSDYSGGGTYDCDISNKEPGRNPPEADISLNVAFKSGSETESDYARWKSSDTRTTGKGYDQGSISGLGSEAYFAAQQQMYSSIPNDYTYICATHDSNISVKVKIEIRTNSGYDQKAMDTACQSQVRKVLSALKK